MITETIQKIIDPRLPQKFKNLIFDLQNKKITMQEFDYQCALWALESLDDYRVHPLPTRPFELDEYYRKKSQNPSYKISEGFWQQFHIREYLDNINTIRNLNSANLFWLKRFLSYIPDSDLLSKTKFQEKINGFEIEVNENPEKFAKRAGTQ